MEKYILDLIKKYDKETQAEILDRLYDHLPDLIEKIVCDVVD